MTKFIYLFIVKIVEFILPLFAYFSKSKKIKDFIKGRQLTIKQLPKSNNRYWFHCASLGEFEQAKPLIEALKLKYPACSIVISFFSPSGYEQQKGYQLADLVIYLPLDTPRNAKKIIELLQPNVVIFVKYEIWYFLLTNLFKLKIPVYLISATFRPKQYIFSFWGKWLFKLLPSYTSIFLQDINSFNLLKSKNLSNISLTGDTRFDRVLNNSRQVKLNKIIEHFKNGQYLLILGSSWEAEEDILFRFLKMTEIIDFKILIAPHNISDSNIESIISKFKPFNIELYTSYSGSSESKIMILNTIGHLASAYYFGDLAIVGGGFTGALHNILEPLSFGVPVIAGENLSKFPEAIQAQKESILFTISISNFNSVLNSFLSQDENDKLILSEKCMNFIETRAGATQIVLEKITII